MVPFLVSLSLVSTLFTNPSPVTGVVVDDAGRPVPRALVQVLAADGSTRTSIFTDADGTFRIVSPPDNCRVQAVLSGFAAASAPCRTDAPLQLTLAVAPIAEHVVVSATRTEAPSGQIAAAVTVFDAGELERRQQPLLADLLREAPGVAIVRTGVPGGVTTMFVRGGESNYTKVLLDGIPLNEPGGVFDFGNVTTENLERVELVRGANSALFGSDAMTGVIQLFTRRGAAARPQARFAIEGGSFSTARASAGVSGKRGRMDYSTDVTGFATDNQSGDDAPQNRAFDNFTGSGSVAAALPHGATLRSIVRLERGRAGTPGQIAFGRPDLDAHFTRHDGVWGLTFDQTAGALHQRASYGVALSRQASTNLVADPDYTPAFDGRTAPFAFSDFTYDSRNDLTRHRASYQADATVATAHGGTHVETAVVDWDGERATLGDALAGTSIRAARDNVGVSLQHQALWPRVFVTGGVRIEHNASFGNAAVPRVAAAWYVRSGNDAAGTTRIHATAGLGIKEPTVLQSFSPNPYFRGNPDLEAERTRALDAGVEQRFARDRVRVDVTGFANRYRNIIALRTIDPAAFTSQYFNIGLTRARGLELSGDVALVSGLRVKAGYTFTDSRILDSASTSAVFRTGAPAFRRPRHGGFADLAWTGGRASIDLIGSFAGRRSDSDFSSLVPAMVFNDGYASWDLRGSARLTRLLSITAAVDNLSNRRRMEPLGYPVLSRAARAGVRMRF